MFDGMANAFLWLMIAAMVVGGAIVAFAVWVVPLLWHLVKPFLHAVTA